MKERELQTRIRDSIILHTELFAPAIIDVKPVWFEGRWIRTQATPGMGDLIVFCTQGNRSFVLEVKRPGKGLNENQVKFRQWCTDNNISYNIAHSVQEALEICQQHCGRWGYIDRRLEAVLAQL